MTRILHLLDRLASAEQKLAQTTFVAPCVPGVVLRLHVEGLVQSFVPNPPGFEGWGLFQPIDGKRAQLRARPDTGTVERYLGLLPRARLIAIRPVATDDPRRHVWWAMPVSREAFRRRFRREGPVVVQLAKDVVPFETLRVRFDGATFWYETLDALADPRLAERLRLALGEWELPDTLSSPGLTPEHRDAYTLALAASLETHVWSADDRGTALEAKLRRALHVGGGRFESIVSREGGLTVRWLDRDGRAHATYLADDASSVRSAGAVCLQGHDADFDLASLVGVVTDAPDHVRYD